MTPPFDKLLVLDLDETLVHANEVQPCADFVVGPYQVVRRPHVEHFLEFAFAQFAQVGVWTAAGRAYAEPVLDRLLDRGRLAFVWCAERCSWRLDLDTQEFVPHKDLQKLRKRGYDPARVLFVDDTPAGLARSYGNVVAVRPFHGDPADDELPRLAQYLRELGAVPNVRAVEKRGWQARFAPGAPPDPPEPGTPRTASLERS